MWSGLMLSTVAAAGHSELVVSSWKLESSSTYSSQLRPSSDSAGGPRFPPAPTRTPARRAISARSDATVLFPLEPVTATIGASAARAKSSTSPAIGTPRAAATRNAGSRTETPGLTTISAAAPNSEASNRPQRISTSGNSDSTAARRGGCSRESTAIMRPPKPARWRMHDSPVSPRADDEHVPGRRPHLPCGRRLLCGRAPAARRAVGQVMDRGRGAHGPLTGASGWPALSGPARP